MDEQLAPELIPKLEALRSFIRTVGTAGEYLPDNQTRASYRAMYDDIRETLSDPLLETYAPPLPHLGTTSDDATLWGTHQIRILESGTRLIAYLDAKLNEVDRLRPSPTAPIRCFLSYLFSEKGNQYADELRHFLELSGIEVVTGERFEPRSVSEKLGELLESELDFGVLIIAENGESFWTRDEVNRVWAERKRVIVLVEEGSDFEQGLQGDLEWIRFSAGYISEAYTKLLEGIEFIRNEQSGLA